VISVRLLSKQEVAEYLQARGYDPTDEILDGSSCWRAPCGIHMTVPELPPDGVTPMYWLEDRVAEIESEGRKRGN
jgi:hypothetical protein